MSRTNTYFFSVLLAIALAPGIASAQGFAALSEPGGRAGTVSGNGIVTVKRAPTLLRMTIQLSEKAESLKEALAQLKDRREAAVLQLETFDAKKDAIKVQPPTLASGDSSQKRRLAQMMDMRRMQGRRVPKALETPEIVTVTASLTAEWDLDMQDREELLLFAKDLQDQITAADLAGLKETKKLSPEAAELAEEMDAMMSEMSYGEEKVKPGEPRFFYVARLSDTDRDEALAKAFQRAKAQASRLAKAADSQLGDLSTLNGMTSQTASDSGSYYAAGMYQMRMMMAQYAQQTGADTEETEAMVPTPSMCSFQVMVQATFKLK